MDGWIFDIDGAVTSIETRKLEHPQILEHIVEKLKDGEYVDIITGRELSWLREGVLDQLENLIENKNLLDLVRIECEFGGVSVTYEKGESKVFKEEKFALPENLLKRLREILNEQFSDVFFDPGKETHFIAEIKHELNPANFGAKKRELAEKIKKVLEEMDLDDQIEVREDALAVNIKNRRLNKHLAADKFLKWLDEKGVKSEAFYVFGDSTSDLQIAEELHSQGRKVVFVYTGEDELGKYPFEISITNAKYDKGTLEYLQSN